MVIDESGCLRASMAIINPNISPKVATLDLPLVLQIRIGLHNCNGEIATVVWFQILVPHKRIPPIRHASEEISFNRPET
jgi:hypothetical protein